MKYFIYTVLFLLLGACLTLLVLLGIDESMAYRDYETLRANGDYEQQVTGCIFDFVCEKYTRELWK